MIRAINILVALLLGAAVTFSLFFLMQYLISSDQGEPEQSEGVVIADITIPEQEVEVQRQEPKPEEPEEPEEVPEIPEPEFNQTDLNPGSGISVSNVDVDLGGLDQSASVSQSDAEYLPIVTIQPQYPTRALQRGIEGWCMVEFTVNENGGVEDPMVVDAEPQGIFNSASLRAVQRFRFNPRTRDGEPVKVPGVRYVFRYELDDEDQ